jgi:hypothetical protein
MSHGAGTYTISYLTSRAILRSRCICSLGSACSSGLSKGYFRNRNTTSVRLRVSGSQSRWAWQGVAVAETRAVGRRCGVDHVPWSHTIVSETRVTASDNGKETHGCIVSTVHRKYCVAHEMHETSLSFSSYIHCLSLASTALSSTPTHTRKLSHE